VVNLLGIRFEVRMMLLLYGSDLPGEGGARFGTWSSSVLSVGFVMFERWILSGLRWEILWGPRGSPIAFMSPPGADAYY